MTSPLSNVSGRRISLALHQLDLPAVHPDSIIRCVKSIIDDKSGLYGLIETDPAAALALLRLCRQSNIEFSFGNLDFQQIVNSIPSQKLLKAFFGFKTFDIENLHSQLPIAEINKSSAARAFAARLIAVKTGQVPQSLSFLAGLFADIGLLGLVELFPKSISMLFEEAQGNNLTLLKLEKENLGVTHNVLSRMLANKWLLHPAIAESAWLYCIPAVEKIDNLPNNEIIITVRLADMLVRDTINGTDSAIIPAKFSLTAQDINEVKDKLKSFIAEQDFVISDRQKFYTETVKQTCLALLENPAEQKFYDFLATVSASLSPASSAIDIAGTICRLICSTFNVEKACIYLPPQDNKLYEAVIAEGDKLQFSTYNMPPELTDIGFEPSFTRRTRLQFDKYFIGEILLQIQDAGLLFDISPIASFAAQLIAVKFAGEHDSAIAQAVIDGIELPKVTPANPTQSQSDLSEVVAEIAAGAAHELNNPLAVISGRAQLLMQSETEEAKRLILNQITEKTKDAHEIVGQLMSYARPARPEIREVSPFIVINNCLEKVNARYLSEPLEISLENIETLNDIEVDPEQIAEAIAQIIYNALESYESGNGPVRIIGSEQAGNGFIEISIKDNGCGMSEETLQKAIQPFFSDKSAGRQRGMGLAITSSLLKNNNCTMTIKSQIDKGTTVTIRLPSPKKSENS